MPENPTVVLTRDSLSLPTLTLGSDTLPFLGGKDADEAVRWQGTAWDRQFAESPWVHGDQLVAARKKNTRLELALWVLGDTIDDIEPLYAEVVAAVEQFSYGVTVYAGTTTYVLRGWVGDSNLGFTRAYYRAFAAPLRLALPVSPLGV